MHPSLLLHLILLLQFTADGHGAAPQVNSTPHPSPSAPSPSKGVKMASRPDVIVPGLTRLFTVTCTFPEPSSLGLASVVSLVISQRHNGSSYQELASVNFLKPLEVTELANVGARVSGRLEVKGSSFLKLEWTHPSEDNIGTYLCEANSLDPQGHPANARASIRVTSKSQDIHSLVSQFMIFTRQQEEINNKLVAQVQKLNMTVNRHNNLVQQFPELFYFSNVTHRKQYLLSRGSGAGMKFAEALCNTAGGHLADIKKPAEFDAIKTFLQNVPPSQSTSFLTYFSLTDEKQEGHWVYGHNRGEMKYTELWASGQPSNNTDKNCAFLSHRNWKVYDSGCAGGPDANFICERYISYY